MRPRLLWPLDRLRAQGPAYEREFGLAADFRAGLHRGPVAVGELGYFKKEMRRSAIR
jgi:hypothetical protein